MFQQQFPPVVDPCEEADGCMTLQIHHHSPKVAKFTDTSEFGCNSEFNVNVCVNEKSIQFLLKDIRSIKKCDEKKSENLS